MKCPVCGADSFVLSTRKGVTRRRECFNEHRFTTNEVVVTERREHKGGQRRNRKELPALSDM